MPDHIAIGDIHGLERTLADLLRQLPATGRLVFLGDYIDRGPSSRDVVERLMRLRDERHCVFLRGNHEAMALATLAGDTRAEAAWFANGGLETLRSFGGRIPTDHLNFLRETRPYYLTQDYIFVHGGLVPGLQAHEMDEEELWWIRDRFLSSDYDWGRLVIHGHTPAPGGKPDIRSNRINIDTGAVYGGSLTALLLPEREFLTVACQETPATR